MTETTAIDDRGKVLSGTKEVSESHRFDEKKLETYLAERIEGFQTPLGSPPVQGQAVEPTYQLVHTQPGNMFCDATAAGKTAAVGACRRPRIPRHLRALSHRLSRRQALSPL